MDQARCDRMESSIATTRNARINGGRSKRHMLRLKNMLGYTTGDNGRKGSGLLPMWDVGSTHK